MDATLLVHETFIWSESMLTAYHNTCKINPGSLEIETYLVFVRYEIDELLRMKEFVS